MQAAKKAGMMAGKMVEWEEKTVGSVARGEEKLVGLV